MFGNVDNTPPSDLGHVPHLLATLVQLCNSVELDCDAHVGGVGAADHEGGSALRLEELDRDAVSLPVTRRYSWGAHVSAIGRSQRK